MGIIDNLSMNGDLVSKHIDKCDLITVLFHVGEMLHGGGTNDYPSLPNDASETFATYVLY